MRQQNLSPSDRLRQAFGIQGFTSFTLLRRFCKKRGYEGFIAVKNPGVFAQPQYSISGAQMLHSTGEGQGSAIIARLCHDGFWELQALESIPVVRLAAKPLVSQRIAEHARVRVRVRKDTFNSPDRRGRYHYPWQSMVLQKELKELALANQAVFDTSCRVRYEFRPPAP